LDDGKGKALEKFKLIGIVNVLIFLIREEKSALNLPSRLA
jgi:hypothetical protein